ncbi:MAG TPA: NfeD family protein [Candidatus Sulfotelmatobacter sp.]|nr:NfeD family protein [Candidatus Sulfotelmatobacter sp.]
MLLWVLLWVAVGIALLAAEAHTNAFFAVFLATGAFAAALFALAKVDVLFQVVGGALIAILGAGLLRPAIVRYQEARKGVSLPGVQNIVGQTALTVDTVGDEHHPGHVVLAGERWLAVSESGTPLNPDSTVTVVSVRGTTLLVRP